MDEVEALAILRQRRRRRLKRLQRKRMIAIRMAAEPFCATPEIFQGLYRLSKELVKALIIELRPHMPQAERSTAVPLEMKVLCALHFYGQGSYQKSAGSDANCRLSQASVSRSIQEVTEAINTPEVLAKWVTFPLTRQERRLHISQNYNASRFPGVLGYIDGTHVAIRAPNLDEFLYVNRKGYHSINVQIICDSSLQILNCVSRFPGSTHDAYIWGQSEVFQEMVEVWRNGEKCWLLGDSGYPHQPWLQTPILNAAEGTAEGAYTAAHVRARSTVERCIGTLKSRFRCLSRSRSLQYAPGKAGRIINACCVLHNMCIGAGLPNPTHLEEDVQCGENPDHPPPLENPRAILREARTVRQHIIHRLFN